MAEQQELSTKDLLAGYGVTEDLGPCVQRVERTALMLVFERAASRTAFPFRDLSQIKYSERNLPVSEIQLFFPKVEVVLKGRYLLALFNALTRGEVGSIRVIAPYAEGTTPDSTLVHEMELLPKVN